MGNAHVPHVKKLILLVDSERWTEIIQSVCGCMKLCWKFLGLFHLPKSDKMSSRQNYFAFILLQNLFMCADSEHSGNKEKIWSEHNCILTLAIFELVIFKYIFSFSEWCSPTLQLLHNIPHFDIVSVCIKKTHAERKLNWHLNTECCYIFYLKNFVLVFLNFWFVGSSLNTQKNNWWKLRIHAISTDRKLQLYIYILYL